MSRPPTLGVEEYLADVLQLTEGPLPARWIALEDVAGCVLAQDVSACLDVPCFRGSAMDGFAVRAQDLAGPEHLSGLVLRVVADIPAGAPAMVRLQPGEAARIMTGGVLPAGADTVVPVEATDQRPGPAPLPGFVRVLRPPVAGANVRHSGEDLHRGDLVLRRGAILRPAAVAAAAATGHGALLVHPRPRVAVLTTGSELVPPGRTPEPGQLPDSNSLLLAGLVAQQSCRVRSRSCVPDDSRGFRAALDEALDADVVLTAGGVSAGAREVVRDVVDAEARFVRVRVHPGKPQGSGTIVAADGRRVPLLALPGNPVAAFVSFLVFAAPLLAKLRGVEHDPRTIRARARTGWSSSPGYTEFMPVSVSDGGCSPTHPLGSRSHLIASLHLADGLAVVPEGVRQVRPGDELDVVEIPR